jgi:hypothetical protein
MVRTVRVYVKHSYYYGDQIKQDEMGGHGDEKCTRSFIR